MEQLARYRIHLISRLQSLVVELGKTEDSILLCQVWLPSNSDDAGQPSLRVEAQSSVQSQPESVRTYASLSAVYGIRKEAMDLIGDCRMKGAIRIIEDLEHADSSQHPRNLLPGTNIPACSALFVPIFDPADPFVQRPLGIPMPTAVLEILVCETAKMRHNNSDLINTACEVLDQYQFGVSSDTTAFRQWSKYLPGRTSDQSSGLASPSRQSPCSGLSRTCSQYLLSTASDDSEDSMVECSDTFAPGNQRALPHRHSVQKRKTGM